MRRTVKDYIVDALFELLKKKDIKSISITDVITKAGVCRASFYRNFYALEDVIHYYLENLGKRCAERSPLTKDKIYEHALASFVTIYEEKEKLTILNARDLLYLYDDVVFKLCEEQMKLLENDINPYSVYMTTGSSVFAIRAWIKNGFRDSPESIVKLFPKFHSDSQQ